MKRVIISMTGVGNASDNQLRLNLATGDETRRGHREEDAPVTKGITDVSGLVDGDTINRTAVVRDPYARWCGRRGIVRCLPMPIRQKRL